MSDMLPVEGRFSVHWSIQDAFGCLYAGGFLFGEDVKCGMSICDE